MRASASRRRGRARGEKGSVTGDLIGVRYGQARFSAAAFVRGSRWMFAKTMPEQPHEYRVRDLPSGERSTCLSHESFEWFVEHIREHGERRSYGGRWYVYLLVT